MSGIVLSVLNVGYTAISDFKKSEISLDRDPFMSVGSLLVVGCTD